MAVVLAVTVTELLSFPLTLPASAPLSSRWSDPLGTPKVTVMSAEPASGSVRVMPVTGLVEPSRKLTDSGAEMTGASLTLESEIGRILSKVFWAGSVARPRRDG